MSFTDLVVLLRHTSPPPPPPPPPGGRGGGHYIFVGVRVFLSSLPDPMTRVRGDPFCLWVSLLFPHDQLACTGTALFAMGPAAQAICECGPKVSHFTTSLHPASASSPLYRGKPHGFSKKPSTGLPMDPTGTACFLPHHNSITSFFPTKDPAVSLFPPQSFLPVLPVPFSVVCPSTTVTILQHCSRCALWNVGSCE